MKIALRNITSVVLLAIAGFVSGCGSDEASPGATGGAGGSGGSGGSSGGDAASDAPAETKIASTSGEWNV